MGLAIFFVICGKISNSFCDSQTQIEIWDYSICGANKIIGTPKENCGHFESLFVYWCIKGKNYLS
jgi:hypothetical protein